MELTPKQLEQQGWLLEIVESLRPIRAKTRRRIKRFPRLHRLVDKAMKEAFDQANTMGMPQPAQAKQQRTEEQK